LEVELTAEAHRILDDAAAPDLGFPHDFIETVRPWVFGAADNDVIEPRRLPRLRREARSDAG